MTTRIAATEITGVYGALAKRFSKKMLGQVPEPLGVMWHNVPVLKTLFAFSGKAQKWDACDRSLKSFAHMATVSLVGCSFCLDLAYFQAHNENLDLDKAREVPRWRESAVFTPLERDVMEYAETMTQTPPAVTDELSARLLEALGAPAMVELTALIAGGEPGEPHQHGARHRVAGLRRGLRPAAARREEYVGEWLPEPLLTNPDVAEDVELAESVSMAMLTVLETLGRTERAVFVLREVFDTSYDEIAEAVGKEPAAVRQIAHRARAHVAARRPRMEIDLDEHQAVVERFLAVLQTGDVQGLLDVLAPDVVLVTDGGGVVAAARRPIRGAEAAVRVLTVFPKIAPGARVDTVWLNGAPAARIEFDGQVAALSLAVENGRITGIFLIANPHKLTRLDAEAELTR